MDNSNAITGLNFLPIHFSINITAGRILDDLENEVGIFITPKAKRALIASANWAKLIAIISFIFFGIFIAITVFAGSLLFDLVPFYLDEFSLGWVYTILGTLIALSSLPLFFLLKYAASAKLAVKNDDALSLTKSMRWIKLFYIYFAVLIILSFLLGIGSFMYMSTIYD